MHGSGSYRQLLTVHDKVALGQAFPKDSDFSPLSVAFHHCSICIHSFIHSYITLEIDGVFK